MASKTILLTGASGLLGSNLLKHLIKDNFRIFALRRTDSDISMCPESALITWIAENDLSLDFMHQLPDTIDYMIHAAGMVSYHKKDKEKLFKINYSFTQMLTEAAIQLNVKKFIFISSISAMGKDTPDQVITENTPYNEHQFNSNYGRSKRAAEQAVRAAGERGLPYIILNPSVIIGAAKPGQSSAQLIYYAADEKPFYTEGVLNYVGVDDVSEIILKSIESRWTNRQWIVSTGAVSYKEFFSETAKILNRRPPAICIPKKGVLAGAMLEYLFSKITGKKPTLTIETAKMAGSSYIYSGERIKEDLSIEFTPLKLVLGRAVREIKDLKYL